MTSGNVTTTMSTNSTHGSTGGVMLPVNVTSTIGRTVGAATGIIGRTRGSEEVENAQDEEKEGSKKSKAESK